MAMYQIYESGEEERGEWASSETFKDSRDYATWQKTCDPVLFAPANTW